MARHFYRYGTQLWKEIESYVLNFEKWILSWKIHFLNKISSLSIWMYSWYIIYHILNNRLKSLVLKVWSINHRLWTIDYGKNQEHLLVDFKTYFCSMYRPFWKGLSSLLKLKKPQKIYIQLYLMVFNVSNVSKPQCEAEFTASTLKQPTDRSLLRD